MMKLGRLKPIGVATPTIADQHSVIASVAKQPSAFGATLDCRVASLLAMTTFGEGNGE